MSKFMDISKEILEVSKQYGELNTEYQNIFEITFVTFMKIVKSLEENLPVSEGTIRMKVYEDLFGKVNKTCKPKIKESNDIDNDLYKKITGNNSAVSSDFGGFNPNESFNTPDADLLNRLKSKVKNINKIDKECKTYSEKVIKEYKQKE